VRNATIVLIDSEAVRAPVVATWLKQLGFDAYVLQEGASATLRVPSPPAADLPALTPISAAELKNAADAGRCSVFDLRPSMSFRRAHVSGSRWTIRPRMARDAHKAHEPVVLIADEADFARLAAIDLLEAGCRDMRRLEGGFDAWTAAGYATEASPDSPPDNACIDYLFFVHDRHAGNRAAMQQYLAWETGLIAQLGSEDRKLFKVGAQ
jgi:rhodanese-related sulfurtransferase